METANSISHVANEVLALLGAGFVYMLLGLGIVAWAKYKMMK